LSQHLLEVLAMPPKKYTDEQKQRFFDLLDKGGNVRLAATDAGVHVDAAYSWLRTAGLTMQRRAPRKYAAEEKENFLRILREQMNISTAARDAGIHRPTAYAWARKAGIFTSEARKVNPRREEFLRLRAEGLTRREAAAKVGADTRSATDWDKGIQIIHYGRIYPDGRVVRYLDPGLSGVKKVRTIAAIGGKVDLEKVEKVIHRRYLSLIDREQIRDLHRTGMSIRKIAAEMGRSPSTISRELKRNTVSPTRGYLPHTAHRLSVQRRARARKAKVIANPELLAYVQEKLKLKWSPEQIGNRMAKEFPNRPEMRVGTETIYQAIYVHARGELKRELAKQLRRGRAARKPQKKADAHRPRFVDPMTPISERPAEAEDREVPGHWKATSSSALRRDQPSRPWSSGPAGSSCSAPSAATAPPTSSARPWSTPWANCPTPCAERSPGTKALRCQNTRPLPLPPTSRSTSATQRRHGSAEATRTPTACCGSTSPRASTCHGRHPRSFNALPTSSTGGRESPSTGRPPPNGSLLYWTPRDPNRCDDGWNPSGRGFGHLSDDRVPRDAQASRHLSRGSALHPRDTARGQAASPRWHDGFHDRGEHQLPRPAREGDILHAVPKSSTPAAAAGWSTSG
jgi:transposase